MSFSSRAFDILWDWDAVEVFSPKVDLKKKERKKKKAKQIDI